jgi:hypothetical protein
VGERGGDLGADFSSIVLLGRRHSQQSASLQTDPGQVTMWAAAGEVWLGEARDLFV